MEITRKYSLDKKLFIQTLFLSLFSIFSYLVGEYILYPKFGYLSLDALTFKWPFSDLAVYLLGSNFILLFLVYHLICFLCVYFILLLTKTKLKIFGWSLIILYLLSLLPLIDTYYLSKH